MAPASLDVLLPTSPEEAIAAFGDGTGVTVVGGGTIVMPEIAAGRLRPKRTLLLARAGLDGLRREGGVVRIGAAVPLSVLAADGPEPLRAAARRVGDLEIRGQATAAGNLCAPPGAESPRGDLQAPLIALGARVRSAGAGGERIEDVEEFLAHGGHGRLVVELEAEEPRRASYQSLGRPHAHVYTVLSVACAETSAGLRIAAGGVGPRAVRLASVERSGDPDDCLQDVEPRDDALASAWYRARMLPKLVARALSDL